jgi:(2Fe-2S) ferredoxin
LPTFAAMSGPKRFQMLICDGPSCGVCLGSEALREHARARVEASEHLRGRVSVINLTCFGRCDDGPNLLVRELGPDEDGEDEPDIEDIDGVRGLYFRNTVARIDRILDEHCTTGEPLEEWVETY